MVIDNTRKFLNLLRHYSVEKPRFTNDDLDWVANSDRPIMPPIESGLFTPQEVFAVTFSFTKLLNGELEWQVIREEAARLSAGKVETDQTREECEHATAFISLSELRNPPVTAFVRQWSEAWNSRNLEVLVSLFSENGIYIDVSSHKEASGHGELRRLFSNMFHQERMKLEITEVSVMLTPTLFVLSWIKTPPPVAPAGDLREPLRGCSVLELQGCRLIQCVDSLQKETPLPVGRIWIDQEKGVVWLGDVWVALAKRDDDGF